MSEESPDQRRLWRVIVVGTALAFGLLAAVIASMKDFIHGEAQFKLRWTILPAFALGCAAGRLFWAVVRRLNRRKETRQPPTFPPGSS